MIRDFLMGYPPVLQSLYEPETRPSMRTPVRSYKVPTLFVDPITNTRWPLGFVNNPSERAESARVSDISLTPTIPALKTPFHEPPYIPEWQRAAVPEFTNSLVETAHITQTPTFADVRAAINLYQASPAWKRCDTPTILGVLSELGHLVSQDFFQDLHRLHPSSFPAIISRLNELAAS